MEQDAPVQAEAPLQIKYSLRGLHKELPSEADFREQFQFSIIEAVKKENHAVIAYRFTLQLMHLRKLDKKTESNCDIPIIVDVHGNLFSGKHFGNIEPNFIKVLVFENVMVVLYPNKVSTYRLFMKKFDVYIAHEFNGSLPSRTCIPYDCDVLDMCINEKYKTVIVLYSQKYQGAKSTLQVRVFPYLIDNSSFDPSPMGFTKDKSPPKHDCAVVLTDVEYEYRNPCSFYSVQNDIFINTADGVYVVDFSLLKL